MDSSACASLACDSYAGAMSCLAQLRGRLGVARLLISELKADGKDVEATSQLQATACEEILAKGFKELDTAQKADLAELAHKAGFQDAHLQPILQRLVKSKAGAGRRESQDFTTFLHYGTASDWDSIESGTEEEIDDALCQILIRLNCVNPCEQTKKVLASAALVGCLLQESSNSRSCEVCQVCLHQE